MSQFFVGQRVILARPRHQKNINRTGRIVEIYPSEQPSRLGSVNCAVDWDHGLSDSRSYEIGGTATHTSQLEPILPSGHQPAELTVEELLPFLREQVSA